MKKNIMNLEKLPKTLTIIGGGYIGLEFATIYSSFGSDVIIIQNEEEFLIHLYKKNIKNNIDFK